MMIDRRTFIVRTAIGAAAAAVASFLSLSSTPQAHASLADPSRTELVAGGMDRNSVVFKIDGWDRRDETAIDGSKIASADSAINCPTGDHVLIKINQSWRTTWR